MSYNSDLVQTEDFFVAQIKWEREKFSKILNKCITALDYADKVLLVFVRCE